MRKLPLTKSVSIRRMAILLFILLLAGNATAMAQAKGDIKIALQNAENMLNIIYVDPSIPLEQYSYLIPNKGKLTVS